MSDSVRKVSVLFRKEGQIVGGAAFWDGDLNVLDPGRAGINCSAGFRGMTWPERGG